MIISDGTPPTYYDGLICPLNSSSNKTILYGLEERPARILVADRSPLLLSALCNIISRETKFRVVDRARTSAELLEKLAVVKVDCLLLGRHLIDAQAPDVLSKVAQLGLQHKTVLFEDRYCPSVVHSGVAVLVDGICYQCDTPDILLSTLSMVLEERICIPKVAWLSSLAAGRIQLSIWERELLGMLANGFSNAQIAHNTGISCNTVKYHLKKLYTKTGCPQQGDGCCGICPAAEHLS